MPDRIKRIVRSPDGAHPRFIDFPRSEGAAHRLVSARSLSLLGWRGLSVCPPEHRRL